MVCKIAENGPEICRKWCAHLQTKKVQFVETMLQFVEIHVVICRNNKKPCARSARKILAFLGVIRAETVQKQAKMCYFLEGFS